MRRNARTCTRERRERRHDERKAAAAGLRAEHACGWCGGSIAVRTTGRIPKWCSPVCRHRAWEQRRAAASGRAAVEVVDRVIEVEKPIPVIERVEVPVAPKPRAWPGLLANLANQVDTGRVYDRDLAQLAASLDQVLQALNRRPGWVRLMSRPRG